MMPQPLTWMASLLLTVTSLWVMTCHGFRLLDVGTSQQALGSRHKRLALENGRRRFGVLLDAGSSSTKVKVYSHTPAVAPSLVPHVKLEVSERVRPGLGSFVSSSRADLTQHLQEVVQHARDVVPSALHAKTPIFLMATAGMRVLPAMDAKALLEGVVGVMGNATLNPFLFHPHHVTILSGEEEAVYAWLAVNYLRGVFSSHKSHPDPAGVLEMGGGSMQVAFLPETPLYQEEFQVYVGRRRFDLYAQTYLSFGSKYLTDQVRRRLVTEHRQRGGDIGNTASVLSSPCMLKNDTDTFKLEGRTYQFRGTGDPPQCEEALTGILQPGESALCSPSPCAIGGAYQPAVGDHLFYAISAFLYAPKTLDAVEEGQVLNITKLKQHARQYCQLTVPEAVSKTGTKDKYASNDCLLGLYIPILLTSALGFSEHSRSVIVAGDINGTRIDWALGAMVQQLSMTFMDDLDPSVTCLQNHNGGSYVSDSVTRSSGSCPLTPMQTLVWVTVIAVWSCRHWLWQ